MNNAPRLSQASIPFSSKEYIDNSAFSSMMDAIKDVPDSWSTGEFGDNKGDRGVTHFRKFNEEIRPYIKYYVWSLIFENAYAPSTARINFYIIWDFFRYIEQHHGVFRIHEVNSHHWEKYIAFLELKVSKPNHSSDKISIQTAVAKASITLGFFNLLSGDDILEAKWVSMQDPGGYLMQKYKMSLTPEELDEIDQRRIESKLQRAISYADLIVILETVYEYGDIYLRTATLIMAHTGLRLSEVVNLTMDCIEPVDEAMARTAKKYLEGKGSILNPDWSQSYWLNNYKTSKTKRSRWTQGTPLLVNKKVYDAIFELSKYTEDYRMVSGKRELFLKEYGGEIKHLSTSSIQHSRRQLSMHTKLPRYTEHRFRHTFASMLYDDNVHPSYIKKYLNHVSEDMVQTYIHVEKKQKQTALKKYLDGSLKLEGPEGEAMTLVKKDMSSATESEYWASWSVDKKVELFEVVLRRNNISISIMPHGACVLPSGENCPNNYGEIEVCFLSGCEHFTPTEESIPFFSDMLTNTKESIKKLEKLGVNRSDEIVGQLECDRLKIIEHLKRIS